MSSVAHGMPGITPGTGVGSVGDPFSYQDIHSGALNTVGLAANDVVAMMTNGAAVDSPTAQLSLPFIQGLLVVPVDYAGALTANRWIVDASGYAGDGFVAASSAAYAQLYMGEIRNSALSGLSLNSGGGIVYGFRIKDSGTKGIIMGTSTRNIMVQNAHISGSASEAIQDNEASDACSIDSCFIEQATTLYALRSYGKITNCIIVLDVTGLTAPGEAISTRPNIYSQLIKNNTVVIKGDKSSMTSDLDAMIFDMSNQSNMPLVLNNLVVDETTGATAQSIYAYAKDASTYNFFFKGNKYYGGSMIATRNFDALLTNEPPANEDPGFEDSANNDYRTSNDITTNVLIQKIAEETPDWIGSGALSHLIGGGGGVSAFIPRGRSHNV